MRSFLKTSFESAFRLTLPPHCVSCGVRLDAEPDPILLCTACRTEVFREDWFYCPNCGYSASAPPNPGGCAECRFRRFRFDGVVPMGVYAGRLRECVLKMKRTAGLPLAGAFGRYYCAVRISSLRKLDVEAVLATPMHWTRRMGRGTNSPDLIARRIARSLKIPNFSKSLRRTRKTRPQAGLTPTKRRDNVRNAFCVKSKDYLKGKRLLLVDDILTTGATCHEIAKVLKAAGAVNVFVAVLARAEGPDSRLPASPGLIGAP